MAEIDDRFRQKCADSPDVMVSALVDSIPYPLIVRDMDYRIVLANSASRDFYGAELLRCRCYEAPGVQGCLCRTCPAGEAARTGKPIERELRHPRTGAHLIISVYPMYDPDGNACGIIETVRDETESHQAVEKVRSLLADVTSKNRELSEWRRSFEYELRAAREIQMRLVPERPVCIAGMCFDFLYRPSGEVGGDLYDVLPLGDGRVGLLVCDASGHGVGAALVAVMLRMVFRSGGVNAQEPARVLGTLNEELLRVVPPGQFATAFYGVYDSNNGRLTCASGGHPSPLLMRAKGGEPEWLTDGGLVLGSLEEAEWEEVAVDMQQGDKLFIYTDGVLDAGGATGERFGPERLAATARAAADARGPDLLRAVIAAIDRFMGASRATDDMTIVLAEPVSGQREEKRWLEPQSHP